MSALNRFHETASDALEKISASLPVGAKLSLTIYTPEKPELDILLQDKGLDLNEVVSTLRRRGLSIDGDNAYKRDLPDSTVGAPTLGAQNSNPPPSDHWGTRFWEIGREERTDRRAGRGTERRPDAVIEWMYANFTSRARQIHAAYFEFAA
ncbi:hypothetical protein [Pseudomonas sp. H3(2019)]|uniref:hypothetical protein n=1 Tax=Pseudomonas sp. H3(2019) TaxID=2598724 RepID=UPI003531A139